MTSSMRLTISAALTKVGVRGHDSLIFYHVISSHEARCRTDSQWRICLRDLKNEMQSLKRTPSSLAVARSLSS